MDSDLEEVIFVGGVVLETKGIPDSHKDFLVTLQALIEWELIVVKTHYKVALSFMKYSLQSKHWYFAKNGRKTIFYHLMTNSS